MCEFNDCGWCYDTSRDNDACVGMDKCPRNAGLRDLAILCRASSAWWDDVGTCGNVAFDKAALIGLMHSELSECLEGVRSDLRDDKLPHRTMEEVELADVLISVLAYCGEYGIDIAGAFVEKLQYNTTRDDHSKRARARKNGKKF